MAAAGRCRALSGKRANSRRRELICAEFRNGSGLERVLDALRIKKRSNRIRGKIRRGAHPLRGKIPVGKRVALQFDEIALWILVVKRNRQSVIETKCRLYTAFAHPVERQHQVGKAVIFEGAMMHSVVKALLWIILQTQDSQKSDPIIRLVI